MNKLSLLFIFLSSFAFGGIGSGNGKITQLYINATGTLVRVKFSQPIKNPGNCPRSEFYIRDLYDNSGSDRFLSALLAAYTAQKNVSFWVDGCTERNYWGGTWPRIHDIHMN